MHNPEPTSSPDSTPGGAASSPAAHGQRLLQPSARWAGDRGQADPAVRGLLAEAEQPGAGAHEGAEHHDPVPYLCAVAALCGARLLLPIVAEGDDSATAPDPDREASMSIPMLRNAAGQQAVLGFTGMDSLQAWQPGARPVPTTLDDVARTAVQAGAQAVVIDVAGPHPLVLEQALLDALGDGMRLVRLDDGGFGWIGVDRD